MILLLAAATAPVFLTLIGITEWPGTNGARCFLNPYDPTPRPPPPCGIAKILCKFKCPTSATISPFYYYSSLVGFPMAFWYLIVYHFFNSGSCLSINVRKLWIYRLNFLSVYLNVSFQKTIPPIITFKFFLSYFHFPSMIGSFGLDFKVTLNEDI